MSRLNKNMALLATVSQEPLRLPLFLGNFSSFKLLRFQDKWAVEQATSKVAFLRFTQNDFKKNP